MDEDTEVVRPNGWAILPFVAFIVIYLGSGVALQVQGVEMAFYQFPAVVSILIATVLAFIDFHRAGIMNDFSIFVRGAGNEDLMCMLMIFLLAGAFSTVAKAMGGIDSTVNLCLTFIPPRFVTAGVFVISAFLSLATGTSMGTVAALVPLALGLAAEAGLSLPLILAACLTGAMLGDNLSMISDTTIAATRTQSVELKDKFRTNFWIMLPAALATIVLLLVFGAPDSAVTVDIGGFNVIKVLPYIAVLVLALMGLNVFLVLLIGIVMAGVVGMAFGDFGALEFATNIYAGFTSMIEVFLLSMFCGGIAELTKHYGGIQWLVEKINALCKGPRSAQVGIFCMTGLVDAATANNTVAIIVTGPLAKDISRVHHVDPRRTASLLDIASCTLQGFLPYGAQMLTIVSLCRAAADAGTISQAALATVDPIAIMSCNWYLMFLVLFTALSILVSAYCGFTARGEWDYDAWQLRDQADGLVGE